MNEINQIQAALRPHWLWHRARLKFLARFASVALSGNSEPNPAAFSNSTEVATQLKSEII